MLYLRVPTHDIGRGTPRGSVMAALAAIVVLISAAPGAAQESITADRPGIGSGSSVLETGLFQVEGGGQFSDSDGSDQFALGQLLLRIGFSQLEVQANLGSWVAQRDSEDDASGFTDPTVGMKIRLPSPSDGGMSLSTLITTTLPMGSSAFGVSEWVPSVTLLADWTVTPASAFSGNLGYGFGPGAVEEVVSLILTPSFSLAAFEGVGVFLGYAGFFASSGNLHFAEAGVTVTPVPDWQLDLNGGVETGSGDFFLGAGLATRWQRR